MGFYRFRGFALNVVVSSYSSRNFNSKAFIWGFGPIDPIWSSGGSGSCGAVSDIFCGVAGDICRCVC